MLCNLLVPHVRKLHRGLESLSLHGWKLSGDSSARQAFLKRLQRSSFRISRDPQHTFVRESGLDSFFGIVAGILLAFWNLWLLSLLECLLTLLLLFGEHSSRRRETERGPLLLCDLLPAILLPVNQ